MCTYLSAIKFIKVNQELAVFEYIDGFFIFWNLYHQANDLRLCIQACHERAPLAWEELSGGLITHRPVVQINSSLEFLTVSNLMFMTPTPFRKMFTFVIVVSIIVITDFTFV